MLFSDVTVLSIDSAAENHLLITVSSLSSALDLMSTEDVPRHATHRRC